MLSQLMCAPRLFSPEPTEDGYRDKGTGGQTPRKQRDSEWGKPQALPSLPTSGGSEQDGGFSRKLQGSQPCPKDFFFSSLFLPNYHR